MHHHKLTATFAAVLFLSAPLSAQDGNRDNPYVESSFQDFMESGYGYMKDLSVQNIASQPPIAGDMRDVVREETFEKQLPAALPAPAPGAEVVVLPAKASVAVVPKFNPLNGAAAPAKTTAESEKQLLSVLNSPAVAVPVIIQEEDNGQSLAGADFKVKSAVVPGVVGVAVPSELYSKSNIHQDLEPVVIAVRKTKNMGSDADIIEKLSADGLFVPGSKTLISAGNNRVVAGIISRRNIPGLSRYPFVSGVFRGGHALLLISKMPPLESGVSIILRIPECSNPAGSLRRVISRLNRSTGFVWEKTDSIKLVSAAGSGNSVIPSVIISVTGRAPFEMVSKILSYPFVDRIEISGAI